MTDVEDIIAKSRAAREVCKGCGADSTYYDGYCHDCEMYKRRRDKIHRENRRRKHFGDYWW